MMEKNTFPVVLKLATSSATVSVCGQYYKKPHGLWYFADKAFVPCLWIILEQLNLSPHDLELPVHPQDRMSFQP